MTAGRCTRTTRARADPISGWSSSGTTALRTSACRRSRCSPMPIGSAFAGSDTTGRVTAVRTPGPAGASDRQPTTSPRLWTRSRSTGSRSWVTGRRAACAGVRGAAAGSRHSRPRRIQPRSVRCRGTRLVRRDGSRRERLTLAPRPPAAKGKGALRGIGDGRRARLHPADLVGARRATGSGSDRVVGPGTQGTVRPLMIDDDLAYVAPWGFDPAAITAPTLLLHGEEDRSHPLPPQRVAGPEDFVGGAVAEAR